MGGGGREAGQARWLGGGGGGGSMDGMDSMDWMDEVDGGDEGMRGASLMVGRGREEAGQA